ncbi:MAG: aminotransferase class V-fold PLP-dependent enzyme [Ornithinimicrobium sp.]
MDLAPPFDAPAILSRLSAYREQDAPTHGGRVLSYVYDSGRPELDALAGDAARMLQTVNGLDPTTFPSVALMEGDLVAFGRSMLHGPTATGSITSGGTESCLLAVKAARDLWRTRHPDRESQPSIVLATSAHAAFHKAAHYLGLDIVLVCVDPATGVPSTSAMTDALDEQTALVVVSAPSYPHGVVDPVTDVAEAARRAGVPCHVDACVGGWILPWWHRAGGSTLPPWDFEVPGVSSISADLHKFGYAPKGTSLLLFADPELDRARYFALTDWLGYPVVNPTVLGTRSATSLAGGWAVVRALGEQGYVDLATQVVRATEAVRAAIEDLPGLRVHGAPNGPLIAVRSDPGVDVDQQVDPHRWAAEVAKRGFVLQGQPGLQQPDGTSIARTTHLTITPVTEGLLAELLPALRSGADAARGETASAPASPSPPDEDSAPSDGIPDPAALAHTARTTGEIDLTTVLALIEALPRDQSAQLLTAFLAEFTAPR